MHRAKLIQLVSLHPVHKGNSMNPLLKVIQLENSNIVYYEYETFDLFHIRAKN